MEMPNRTPVLYLLIGGIASGKSTLAKILEYGLLTHADLLRVNVICPDTIRGELVGNESDQSVNGRAWALAYERMHATMTARVDVIFDAAYMVKARTRKIMQDYARKYGYRVVYIIIDTSVEEALAANALRDRKVPEDVVARYHIDLQRSFPFINEDKVSNGEVQ
jgi:predicted kinase